MGRQRLRAQRRQRTLLPLRRIWHRNDRHYRRRHRHDVLDGERDAAQCDRGWGSWAKGQVGEHAAECNQRKGRLGQMESQGNSGERRERKGKKISKEEQDKLYCGYSVGRADEVQRSTLR